MTERISLDIMEIMTPKELGEVLLDEVNHSDDEDIEYIKSLVNAGANLEVSGEYKLGILHYIAYRCRSIDAARIVLENGVNPNMHDAIGRTPLHLAVRSSDIVEILISSGADVNARDGNGCTPLHYAGEGDYRDFAIKLIELGADIYAMDDNDATPLDMASPGLQEIMYKRYHG